MTEDTAGFLLASVVWIGFTFFTVKDLLRNHAEVQFITGIFTPISREQRPRTYWAVTLLRLSFVVVLGIALAFWIGERL